VFEKIKTDNYLYYNYKIIFVKNVDIKNNRHSERSEESSHYKYLRDFFT